jgi:ketosteroid isomerase-like protein
MKSIGLLIGMTLAVSITALGDSVGEAAKTWTEAVVKRDEAALGRVLEDRLYFAHADGSTVQTKKGYLDWIVKAPSRYEAFEFREQPSIRIYGRTAVLSGNVNTKEAGREPAFIRVMQVYVEKNGKWQLAASAFTAVGPRGPGGLQPGPPSAASSSPKQNSVRASVKGVLEGAAGWTQAVVKKDKVSLAQYLAEDLMFVHSNGSTIQNKVQYLAAVERSTYEALSLSEIDVRSFGKLAVLTAHIDTKNVGRDAFRVRTFQVFTEKDDRWQLAAFQSTRVSAASPAQ